MAVVRDPTQAEIELFLCTRSGSQMVQLVQAIRVPMAQAALTSALLLIPPPPPVASRSATPEKAKKALNAFVGFRCFYISIPAFKAWPMKRLSNLLAQLWETDPNKPLWSMMAKAWSTIRDQIGKDQAPLDQFFRIICSFLNMPTQEMYLELHGWCLGIDEEGGPTLYRDDTTESTSMSAGLPHMALSVEDIIAYCQSMGYAQGYVPGTNTTSPTFLGQSINLASGKTDQAKVAAQTAGSANEGRLIARNKRRAKRQTARDTGLAPILQEQIISAHATDTPDHGLEYDNIPVGQPNSIYDTLAVALAEHMANAQYGATLPNDMAISSNMFDENVPTLTDWSAFRLGANEDVTLPTFDPASL
ncbi:DNA binding protein with alpha box domain [Clathrospora elynae]|uniref:Mating-type protein MAT-1 n=1 Tax=Clathrospora elynae TaxID=706981 RepID=A0A6A5T2V0_9PLEO|nr:DNA binding protein with alpha box domain [Clathrospora elynae]